MKVKLQIAKHDAVLFAATYDIGDAESFGRACADVWTQLRQQQFDKETSIGALMEQLGSALRAGVVDLQEFPVKRTLAAARAFLPPAALHRLPDIPMRDADRRRGFWLEIGHTHCDGESRERGQDKGRCLRPY